MLEEVRRLRDSAPSIDRVVGGSAPIDNDSPYYAMISVCNNNHGCLKFGGSAFISPTIVLTSAQNIYLYANNNLVDVNSAFLYDVGPFIPYAAANSLVEHPNSRGPPNLAAGHDVALLGILMFQEYSHII